MMQQGQGSSCRRRGSTLCSLWQTEERLKSRAHFDSDRGPQTCLKWWLQVPLW